MRLTYVRLLVADFAASFRFYRDVMAFKPVWGSEGEGGYGEFDVGGGCGLALFDRVAMSAEIGTSDLPVTTNSQDRLALVFGVDNIDSTYFELRDRGAAFVTDPTSHPDWGIRTAHLRDPDGNLIEINSPIPHEQWDPELQDEAARYSNQQKENDNA
jgi:catechol 2,3-dioxygenase-like lactoylglutathione lyase family enzyme